MEFGAKLDAEQFAWLKSAFTALMATVDVAMKRVDNLTSEVQALREQIESIKVEVSINKPSKENK